MGSQSRRLVAAFVVLSLAWAVSAHAQVIIASPSGSGGKPGERVMTMAPGMYGGAGGADAASILLWNEAIQKELELVDEQKGKIREAMDEARQEMKRIYNEQLRNKLQQILLPHQWDRFCQIQIQLRGPQALDDAEVIDALKITPEQKERLARIRQKVEEARKAAMTGSGQVNWREMNEETRRKAISDMQAKWNEIRKLTEEAAEEAMNVLTAQQREELDKLRGAKFEWPRARWQGAPVKPPVVQPKQ